MPRIAGNQTNADRSPTDLYPTDPDWTRALLRRVTLRGEVWECAAGDMDMARVLRQAGHSVRATDILAGEDFLQQSEPWQGSIVTNPPYSLAEEFVDKALSLASEQVAMLLPLGALGGIGRLDRLWSVRPPSLFIVVSRRMTVLGKPSQFYHVWAVWDPQLTSNQTVTVWERG